MYNYVLIVPTACTSDSHKALPCLRSDPTLPRNQVSQPAEKSAGRRLFATENVTLQIVSSGNRILTRRTVFLISTIYISFPLRPRATQLYRKLSIAGDEKKPPDNVPRSAV